MRCWNSTTGRGPCIFFLWCNICILAKVIICDEKGRGWNILKLWSSFCWKCKMLTWNVSFEAAYIVIYIYRRTRIGFATEPNLRNSHIICNSGLISLVLCDDVYVWCLWMVNDLKIVWCLGVEHRQCKSTQIYTTWYNMMQHVICRSFRLPTRNERSQFWQFWQSWSLTTPRQPDLVTCSTLGTREPWHLAADAVAGPWTSSLAVEASCFQGKAERPVGMNLMNLYVLKM